MSIKTTNIPASNIAEEIIGNRTDGVVSRTVRIPVDSLAVLLADKISVSAFGGATHESVEAGIAATDAGAYFAVPAGTAGGGLTIYRNVAGSAVEVAELPGAASAADVVARVATVESLTALAGQAIDPAGTWATRLQYVVGTEPLTMFSGPAYGPGDFKTWIVGINPPRTIRSRAAAIFRLAFSEVPAQIGVRVVRRPGAVGDGSAEGLIWPSAHADDVIVQDLTWHDAQEVLSEPALYGNLQVATIPLASYIGNLTPNYIYFVQIYAINAAYSYINIGIQRGRNRNIYLDPLWKVGGFSQELPPGSGGFTPSDGGMVAYTLAESVYEAGDGAIRTEADWSRVSLLSDADPYQATDVSGAWSVTLPLPAIDIQPEPRGLSSSNGVIQLGVPKPTPGLVRYDVVALQTDTGQALTAQGTERAKDAVEYRPSNTGFSRLGYLRVSETEVEFIQTSGFRGLVRCGEEAEFAAHLRRNRALLPQTMRAVRRGMPITLIVYSDSIFGVSAGITGDYYTPNGANRDVPGYLEDYPADTLATLPRYDGDGGAGAHVHIGAHWKVAETLEAAGSPVRVLNMAIGGTISGDGFTTSGAPNARQSGRISALLGQIATTMNPLVLMCFGMNALGLADIYTDYLSLIPTIRVAGADVLITTCPRPGRRNGAWTQTDYWLYTTGQTIRAAQDAAAAYVDLSKLFGDGYLGSIGMSREDLCGANGSNHPGVYEHGVIGEYFGLNFGA